MENVGRYLVLLSFVVHASASEDCGPPPTNTVSEVRNLKLKYSEGDKVQYRCRADYETVSGSPSIQCVEGRWTPLMLDCQERRCELVELLNGQVDYPTGNSIGKKAHAVCDDGYILKGPEYIQCTKTGWSGVPSCEESSDIIAICPDPAVANGVVVSGAASVYHYGDSLNFNCTKSFSLIGSKQITCGLDGQWQPAPPRCQQKKIYCPALNIPNSRHKNWKKAGSIIHITCNKPFQLRGSATLTCSQEGRWIGEIPTCSRPAPQPRPVQECRAPDNVANLVLMDRYRGQTSFPNGTQIRYECVPGFIWENGVNCRICKGGRWTDPQMTCNPEATPIQGCGEPDYVPGFLLKNQHRGQTNFPEGTRVGYQCDVGLTWVAGSKYRTCTRGRWDNLTMKCERKSCGSAGEILNGEYVYTGVQFGDTATARCNEGYILVGRSRRTCLDAGWDGREALCEAVQCAEPPNAPNLERSGDMGEPFLYGQVISYHCPVGKMIGESTIYCTSDGTWSAEPPSCNDVRCPVPVFSNARRTEPVRHRYQVGDRVSFHCLSPRRGSTVTCGPDGIWQPARPCGW